MDKLEYRICNLKEMREFSQYNNVTGLEVILE